MAEGLATRGVGVVSGLAQGVDTAAHMGAVDGAGETWAFLGSSIDQADSWPRDHFEPILDAGGVIWSELPPTVRADSTSFVRRNRLISGAADVVVVGRAGLKSGTAHTVEYAKRQERPLMAVPGDPGNTAAAGCLKLLQEGEAKMCRGVDDVLAALGLADVRGPRVVRRVMGAPPKDETSARVLAALSTASTGFDELVARLQPMSSGAVAAALMGLQLEGWVLEKSGRRYERVESNGDSFVDGVGSPN